MIEKRLSAGGKKPSLLVRIALRIHKIFERYLLKKLSMLESSSNITQKGGKMSVHFNPSGCSDAHASVGSGADYTDYLSYSIGSDSCESSSQPRNRAPRSYTANPESEGGINVVATLGCLVPVAVAFFAFLAGRSR
jgi:hypothetical protein